MLKKQKNQKCRIPDEAEKTKQKRKIARYQVLQVLQKLRKNAEKQKQNQTAKWRMIVKKTTHNYQMMK